MSLFLFLEGSAHDAIVASVLDPVVGAVERLAPANTEGAHVAAALDMAAAALHVMRGAGLPLAHLLLADHRAEMDALGKDLVLGRGRLKGDSGRRKVGLCEALLLHILGFEAQLDGGAALHLLLPGGLLHLLHNLGHSAALIVKEVIVGGG